jgi:hypothetical protein
VLGMPERSDRHRPTSTESRESEHRERRIAAGTLVVRQRTCIACVKKRRVIPETDSDEEEGGSGETRV